MPQTWEIQLKPGLNLIGRSSSNHFTINDPSVSSTHCEVFVSGGPVQLKDADSTNGTFVDGARIQTTVELRPGQRVRLGSVEMVYSEAVPASAGFNLAEVARMELPGVAAPATPAPSPAPAVRLHTQPASTHFETAVISAAPAVIEAAEPVFCKNHYQNAALYYCAKCRRYLCDLCVNTRGSSSGGSKSCKICAGAVARVSVQAHLPKEVDFFRSLAPAFKYPVIGDGVMLLVCGALFFGALDLSYWISLKASKYGMRAMTLRAVLFTFVFGTGYLFSYLKRIVHCTASGEQRMPDWPELTEWQADILGPMFQFLMISLVSFAPGLVVYTWFDFEKTWQVWLTFLFGCFYFPMALLGVAMFDTLKALNPLFILASILKVPREYAVASLIFAGILVVRWLCENGLRHLIHIPLVPTLFADLVGIYLLIVETRILGLLYISRKDALGWFD